jgi:protein-S-isoprenylcysteine O-methyltransferase Ste14
MDEFLRTAARFRVPVGFIVAALALAFARPSSRTLALGLPIAVLGECIRVWAAGHLFKGREVTSTGPYRLMRHPLYVGSSLLGLGFAIASGSLVAGGVVLVYLCTTLLAAVRVEESALREKFGVVYDAYASGAPPREARRFSFRLAIRNGEQRALAGLVVIVVVLMFLAGCPDGF